MSQVVHLRSPFESFKGTDQSVTRILSSSSEVLRPSLILPLLPFFSCHQVRRGSVLGSKLTKFSHRINSRKNVSHLDILWPVSCHSGHCLTSTSTMVYNFRGHWLTGVTSCWEEVFESFRGHFWYNGNFRLKGDYCYCCTMSTTRYLMSTEISSWN